MSKGKDRCKVIKTELLAPAVYSLWLEADRIAGGAVPGQFVSLFCGNRNLLLPRPISLCEIDRERGLLRLVYRVVGAGTKEFSELSAGDFVEVMGPLGNGFECRGERPLLIGGGIGIPPMVELAKRHSGQVAVAAGYRDANLFLKEELERFGRVIIATDDGSVGTKGTVIDAIREEHIMEGETKPDVIYACGPTPMLRGVKAFGLEHQIPVYLSLEERMACGVGACLGCVCKSTSVDEHSMVENKRVCKDGPVFLSTDVEI